MFSKKIFNLISRKQLSFISSFSNRAHLLSNTINKSQRYVLASTSINTSRNFFTSKLILVDEPTKSEEKTPTDGEKKLIDMLRQRFPKAKAIEVLDISGGCGSMYAIYVETIEFKNIRTVKQHQLINDVLRAEIKNNMHGLRIQTAVPDS